MRNLFKERVGRLRVTRRQRQRALDELHAERGRANQPKPQAQPPMVIWRRSEVYAQQRGWVFEENTPQSLMPEMTPRQRRRYDHKALRQWKREHGV